MERMRKTIMLFTLLLLSVIGLAAAAIVAVGTTGELPPNVGPAPVAEKIPTTITVHGDTRVDDYFWLRE